MITQNIRRIMINKCKNYCIQLLKNVNTIQKKKIESGQAVYRKICKKKNK